MEIAYLGLFEKIFNWVLDRIFDPIFKWLSNLLTTVFSWLFEEILEPILLPILKEVMEWTFELWMDIFSTFIYSIFAGLLKLIDYMETAFDIFIGLRDVSFTSNGVTVKGSLLEVLMQQDSINTIFWVFTLAGLGIALMLTIYATAKSAFDLDFENRRPVSKVLTSMMKTFLTFFTVPFFVYFFLRLATVILSGITYALNGGNNATLGRIVFVIASLDAVAKDPKYNISNTTLSITLGTDKADRYRYPYYIGDLDYGDISKVAETFDLSEFDYLIGFLAGIFLLVVIALCLLTFVQRIFEVILLYAVSPYFVSTIPLDEGERFGRWRDMFIAKVFTGFGSAIGMRLYLMVCPMIMGNTIKFGSYVSSEMDYMMKLFFLIGGAWAVYKSGPMITSLFSQRAVQSESATQEMVGGFIYGHTVGKAASLGKSAVSGAFRGGDAGKGVGSGGSGSEKTGSNQKFDGAKNIGSISSKSVMKTTEKPSNLQSEDKKEAGTQVSQTDPAQSSSQWKSSAKQSSESHGGTQIGSKQSSATSDVKPSTGENATGTSAGTPGTTEASGSSEESSTHNLKLGSLFSSSYDEFGNHKVRVLGIGTTKDANGKTTSVRLPGLKLRKTAPDASYKVSKLHIPGVAKVKSNLKTGDLKHSDISILGMKYHKEDGKSDFRIGKHFNVSHGQDGKMSHLKIGAFKVHDTAEDKGFDLGKLNVRKESDGTKVDLGSSFSLKTRKGDKSLSSFRLGSIEYNRNGTVTRATDETETGGDKA